jgi:hypothetical protein
MSKALTTEQVRVLVEHPRIRPLLVKCVADLNAMIRSGGADDGE